MMPIIEFRGFSKRNGDFRLKDVSFQIEQGYITGLIGPNGSGKTTLIRSMMNLVRPDAGEVLVFGDSYAHKEREIKRRIGFVYDEDYFYDHLTVNEMRKIIASFYPSWNDSVFHTYLKQFGVPEKRRVGDLSKGTKTKFALAAALAHEPELLIMDEPTSGLDPVFRREVLSIISEYIRDGERSVLFSTHISADLERIADYIVYVRNGKIRFTGSKEQLLDTYMLIKGPVGLLERMMLPFAGMRQTALGFEGLIPIEHYSEELLHAGVAAERPTLDDILVYTQGGK